MRNSLNLIGEVAVKIAALGIAVIVTDKHGEKYHLSDQTGLGSFAAHAASASTSFSGSMGLVM